VDILEYNGETYTRRNKKWVDSRNLVVHSGLQRELDERFIDSLDIDSMSARDAIEYGDKFKESTSYSLAIRFYEHATEVGGEKELAIVLPRITACYRKLNKPENVIKILTIANKKYGMKIVDHVLLTSAAAAYCDLGDFESAEKCCKRAYAILDGKPTGELYGVWGRIDKAMGIKKHIGKK